MNGKRYIDEVDYEGYSTLAMDIAELLAERAMQSKYKCHLPAKVVQPEKTPSAVNINSNIYG